MGLDLFPRIPKLRVAAIDLTANRRLQQHILKMNPFLKMANRHLCALLLLLPPLTSFALDSSKAVKVTPVLKTTQSWNGTPLAYPEGIAEVTGLLVEIAPGGETGWHLHPVPSFGIIVQGELRVELKNGATKYFKAGEAISEVVDTAHNGRNVGKTPVKIIVFYAGAVDKKTTVKEPTEIRH
jgi:quercetin dioxygenase-like cupin family protein